MSEKVKTVNEKSDFSFEELQSKIANAVANDINGGKLKYRIDDSIQKIKSVVKESVAINDQFGNSLTATGTDDKVKAFNQYGFSNETMNWMLWSALYNDSWVFKRAIDKPAQDMVSCGITFNSKEADKLTKEYKKYTQNLIELVTWGFLFGGSVAVMMFDNVKNYSKPLTKDIIKEAKAMKLYITDRWYGCAPSSDTVTKMTDPDFGKPAKYTISFANGKDLLVHHSFILRYEHRTAPKLIKNGQLQGWGYAEGAHIINELARDDELKSAITSLVNKSLIEVIKMDGMRGVFLGSDKKNQEQLTKRLEMVNWGRNFNSLTFLDSSDSYEYHNLNVGGLSDLMEKNMRLIAAALEMQGVLYGDLDGGFSADTVAMERYDKVNLGRCEALLRPVLEKFLPVLYTRLGIEEEVQFDFNSLLMSKQDEKRLEGMKDFASLISQLIGDGVLTPAKSAKALQTYLTKGAIDFDINEDYIKELEENEKIEAEDYNDDEDEELLTKKEIKKMKKDAKLQQLNKLSK